MIAQPTNDVQPGPTPTAMSVATVVNDAGDCLVLLRVSTAQGVQFYFLEPDLAVRIGKALRDEGKVNLAHKLVTPPSGIVMPGLRPA